MSCKVTQTAFFLFMLAHSAIKNLLDSAIESYFLCLIVTGKRIITYFSPGMCFLEALMLYESHCSKDPGGGLCIFTLQNAHCTLQGHLHFWAPSKYRQRDLVKKDCRKMISLIKLDFYVFHVTLAFLRIFFSLSSSRKYHNGFKRY